MTDLNQSDANSPTPTQVIAKALVERQGPRQIASQADQLGLPRPLTRAMLAACCLTAVDHPGASRARTAATP
jgi:hypothetical protein